MACLAAKARARPASRAATAVTSTSLLLRAGLMRAPGAMRAAPRHPMRTRSVCAPSVPSAHEAAGAGSGGLTVLVRDLAGYHCRHVAVDVLHQPPPASRQVEHHLRRVQRQAVEIDDVQVALLARAEHPSIIEAVERRGRRGLEAHSVLDGDALAPGSVTRPVGEEERR